MTMLPFNSPFSNVRAVAASQGAQQQQADASGRDFAASMAEATRKRTNSSNSPSYAAIMQLGSQTRPAKMQRTHGDSSPRQAGVPFLHSTGT